MNSPASATPGLPLAARMALVIGGFGLVGSAGLVWWVLADEARLSRQRFLEEGRSNAAFIERTGLPASPQMASQLSEVLGVDVRFRDETGKTVPPLTPELPWSSLAAGVTPGEVLSSSGWELLSLPLKPGRELWLARRVPPAWKGLLRPGALTGLGVFWASLLVLAAGLGRTLVRPVRALAGALPGLSDDAPLEVPAVARRRDEIGALAEGLAATHAQLIQERRRRLESERMALLGKMAAGLAHEINNPAAAIRLHAQLLARAAESGRVDGTTAQLIAAEAGRIEELVNQWLFLTRPAPPQSSPVLLRQLIAVSTAAAQPAAEHAGVRIAGPDNFSDAAVTGDFRRLRQVMGNLLTNAIHASPQEGVVRLSVQRSADGIAWEILCLDQGEGFSRASLQRGTELFFSEKEGGLGIGLSVSAEIAVAHGGSLILSNPSGGGALVTLSLPASAAP